MIQLLKIELYKSARSSQLLTIWGIYALFFGLIALIGVNVHGDQSLDTWDIISSISQSFNLLLFGSVILDVSNEFIQRTAKQSIASGISRWEFVYSKTLMSGMLALASMLMVFITALTLSQSKGPELDVLSGVVISLKYGLGVYASLCVALFLTVWIKKFWAFFLFIFFPPLEKVILSLVVNQLHVSEQVASYFPMRSINSLTANDITPICNCSLDIALPWVIVTVWSIAFTAGSYAVFRKADL